MSDPDLTPEEQQVRRLLADARHDEPLPDDVAARLDGVLADLGAEPRSTAPVVDLAARRRRRVVRNVLVAAAAVVVVGVGISRVDLGASGDADSGTAESSAQDDGGGSGRAPSAAAPEAVAPGRVLRLTSEDFDERLARADAAGGLDALAARTQDELDQGINDYSSLDAPPGWCNDAAWGRGLRIAVRYDGEPGVLVLRRASGGTREADLYLCGETTPTRSTTVPAG
ncbi:hypothetical protein ASC77_14395 [Nocardioides sp. Root1257]|uniref:hypothetical protein n=1 Tax=unclassified Nocardioides TaxID=2615069 RepID=UPI000700F1F0|nr:MULTISPECIES: hypothetical protein [unclassified Nocardioides]KQW47624.1 hypothetical protein ASC77_14395 [Nocardioides sp. Root1257]KRC45779.1 hypothetical protein ASE24_14395 [Nocardioides sp. Root224]